MAEHVNERETLGFEMWMLRLTQEQITAWEAARAKQIRAVDLHVYIATLESFLVHARNLIRFFYPPPKPHRHDLVPGQFFEDRGQRWSEAHSEIPDELRQWLGDINTTIQHMSGVRPDERIEWDELRIREALDALFEEFNALGPFGGPVVAIHRHLGTP